MVFRFDCSIREDEIEGESGEVGENWNWILENDNPSLTTAKNYRKYGKKLNRRLRRQLLQASIEALLKEGQIIASKGGIITKKTEILPYKPGTEWDLDSSLDKMISSNTYKLPSYHDLLRRETTRSRRCFVLMADRSNSLGPTIDYVSLAVSVFANAVCNEDYAVLLFNERVKILKPVGRFIDQAAVLEEILNIECLGATNLHLAFEIAKKQLEVNPPGTEGICVLISDCIPTVGPDPVDVVNLLPKLEVLLLQNEGIVIGSSYADKLEVLPKVNMRKIRELNDIIDAVQDIISYGSLDEPNTLVSLNR